MFIHFTSEFNLKQDKLDMVMPIFVAPKMTGSLEPLNGCWVKVNSSTWLLTGGTEVAYGVSTVLIYYYYYF